MQIDTETYLAYLRQIFVQKGARKLLQVTECSSVSIEESKANLRKIYAGGRVKQNKVESLKSLQVTATAFK